VSEVVVDASAVLALLNQEKGADLVADAVAQGAAICTVNLSEVAGKLSEAGMPELAVRTAIDDLNLEAVDFGAELADK
jgi:PIN domain nuclease of toxin-antitoxin system